jgi:hypothetical protein
MLLALIVSLCAAFHQSNARVTNTARSSKLSSLYAYTATKQLQLHSGSITACINTVPLPPYLHTATHTSSSRRGRSGSIAQIFAAVLVVVSLAWVHVEPASAFSGPAVATPTTVSAHAWTSDISSSSSSSTSLPLSSSSSSISSSSSSSSISSSLPLSSISKKAGKDESKTSFLYGLVSGAVSKAAKEVVLHPIDTVKSRIQMQKKKTRRYDDITDTNTEATSLFSGLFDGLVPSLAGGIPAAAVFFAAKDWTKTTIKAANKRAAAGEDMRLDPLLAALHLDSSFLFPISKEWITVLGVVIANVPHWLVRSPTEVLKIREQLQVNNTK